MPQAAPPVPERRLGRVLLGDGERQLADDFSL